MINFFKENKVFDIKQFMLTEKLIMSRWEDMETIHAMDESQLINRFSLYMCHISDELKEVIEAQYREDYLMELIDVAMYVASAGNLFAKKYLDLYAMSTVGEELIDNENEQFPVKCMEDVLENIGYNPFLNEGNKIGTHWNYGIETLVTKVMYNLSSIRELYPHRKWHKNHLPFEKQVYINALINSYKICIDTIHDIMDYVLSLTDSMSLINNFINLKQRKILNDALNEKDEEGIPTIDAQMMGSIKYMIDLIDSSHIEKMFP